MTGPDFRDQIAKAPIVYYDSGIRCPGCTARNWEIGRKSAECARCGYVLPLSPESSRGA
jgi:hypothetical protein